MWYMSSVSSGSRPAVRMAEDAVANTAEQQTVPIFPGEWTEGLDLERLFPVLFKYRKHTTQHTNTAGAAAAGVETGIPVTTTVT